MASPAPAAPAPGDPAADKAFEEIRTVLRIPNIVYSDKERWQKMSDSEHKAITAAEGTLVAALAERFFYTYPADPRRWEAVFYLTLARRSFAGPAADADKAAWGEKVESLTAQLIAAPDAPPEWKARVLERKVYAQLHSMGPEDAPDQKADFAAAAATLAQMAAVAPGSDRRRFAEQHYLETLVKDQPAVAEAHMHQLVLDEAANPGVAEMASGMLHVLDAERAPLELKFTAVDGREVDLSTLRGKVVLIDFWATWCGPCMHEMPEVKAVYEKYHAAGLEIVGISFDKAPADTAKPRSFEKTAEQLRKFLVDQNMPWPQFYDGMYWSSKYGKQFSIDSIPAMFVLDKRGVVVRSGPGGFDLEAEVKKQLGI